MSKTYYKQADTFVEGIREGKINNLQVALILSALGPQFFDACMEYIIDEGLEKIFS